MRRFSRCALILILVAILSGIGGYFYENATLTPMYESVAQLYVIPGQNYEASIRASNGGLKDDFTIVFSSEVIMSAAKVEAGTSEDIASYLTVTSPENSNIVELKITNPDQITAKNYVDAVAKTAIKATSIIPVESIQILTEGSSNDKVVKPDLYRNTSIIVMVASCICIFIEIVVCLFLSAFKSKDDRFDAELEYERRFGQYAAALRNQNLIMDNGGRAPVNSNIVESKMNYSDVEDVNSADIEESLRDVKIDAEQAKAQLSKLKTEAEAAKLEAEASKAEIAKSKTEAEAARLELQASKGAFEEAQNEAKAAKTEAEAARAEVDALKTELENAKQEAENAKAEAMKASDGGKNNYEETQAAKAEAEAARTEALQAKSEAESAREAAEAAKAEAEALKAELESAKQEAETAKEEAKTAKEEAKKVSDNNEQAASGEVEAAKAEAEIAKTESKAAKAEAEMAKTEAELAKAEAAAAKAEAEALRAEALLAKEEAARYAEEAKKAQEVAKEQPSFKYADETKSDNANSNNRKPQLDDGPDVHSVSGDSQTTGKINIIGRIRK